MYSNVGKGAAKLSALLLFGLLIMTQAGANQTQGLQAIETAFTALPEQCVTLRQGRACFATVELQWQSASKYNFCLYQEGKKKQLGCWQDNNHIQIKVEFESNKSVKYQLRTLTDDKVLAETQVEVSWQHKNTSRKRRWRLF